VTSSTVPGIIAWPLIVFMTLVLFGRYRSLNNTLYERYFNNTLAFLLAAEILREHLIQNMLVRTSFVTTAGTWQLSTAVLGYSFTELIGFSLLWSGMSEADTLRKHRYYRLAGVLLVTGFLICGARARLAQESIEFTRGWGCLTTLSCLTAMLIVLATHVMWNSLRELRTASNRRERVIALTLLAMGLVAIGIVLQEAALQLFDQIGWTHTADYRTQSHAASLFYGIGSPFVIAAVPLAMKLLGFFGLDPITHSWRKLQPLRQAMRTVVPECIFDFDDETGRRNSQLQLHQTVVEIRDAILRLRPYFREIPDHDRIRFLDEPHAVPARDRDAAIAALRLAHAARAKAAGVTPDPLAVDSALIVASRAATLEEEAAELAALAKWWPAAHAATDDIIESAAATKPGPTTI
jgi:hypothetical protein